VRLPGCNVWLSGDGRCDSPGYCTKYCTYTMLEQDSGLIADFHLVQVTPTTNSTYMEKEGFHKYIQEHTGKLNLKLFATERHLQFGCAIKKEYPKIIHQNNVWHVAKSITKKMTEFQAKWMR
jgi:hypothetical protein